MSYAKPKPPHDVDEGRDAQILHLLGPLLGSDPIAVVDEQGRVQLWSAALEELTGLTARGAEGTPWSEMVNELGLSSSSAALHEGGGERGATLVRTNGEQLSLTWSTRRLGTFTAHTLRPHETSDGRAQEQLLRYAHDLVHCQRQMHEMEEQITELVVLLDRAYIELAASSRETEAREASRVPSAEGARSDPMSILGAVDDDGSITFHSIKSRCPKMFSIFQIVKQVGATTATVLIQGDSGTGKELIARALHDESDRKDGPFVAINCAALNTGVAESLLFGHVKGAFTGAVSNHVGVFGQAHGGTLFLDEIAEMPLELQTKLLRAIQERTVSPVGSTENVDVDVRLISATHRDLLDDVAAGRFREDLMYRLRVVPLFLPALHERDGDVEVLIRHLIARHNAMGHREVKKVEPAAIRVLVGHQWPGNVRELENALQYAFAVGDGDTLRARDLPTELLTPRTVEAAPVVEQARARVTAEAPEEQRIRNALAASGGRIAEAAKMLGMSRATFYRRRRELGI